MKKFTLFTFALLGCLFLNAQDVTYTDMFADDFDFVTATDYSNSIWDGYKVNNSSTAVNNATVEQFAAVDGGLSIMSLNGNFEADKDDGAYIYKVVPGGIDFSAELKLAGGYFTSFQDSASFYNSAGIVVRNPDNSAQNNLYFMFFEIFNIHSMIKSNVDGVQAELVNSMDTYPTIAAYPFMKASRVGNMFALSVSADGFSWTETVSVERADFAGIDLEVGITQCNFFSEEGDPIQGAVLDNFSLTHARPASIDMNQAGNSFKAYSIDNQLIIESQNEQLIQSSKLYSIVGREVASMSSIRDNRVEFNNLNAGIYIAEVNIDGIRMTKKVVIR